MAASTRTMTLPDGRTLAYIECGYPAGKPVFCFDGWPSSRLAALLMDSAGHTAGVRVIGVDRPGMGQSSVQPRRRVLDWPDDVAALADALGIRQFGVVGISGGGPYALACAYKIPERLAACGVVSSVAPADLFLPALPLSRRLLCALGRRSAALTGLYLWWTFGRFRADPDRAAALVERDLANAPEPDRVLVHDPDHRLFVEQLCEAYRQGAQGPGYEGCILLRDWGFQLQDLAFEPLYLWHGELDSLNPLGSARAMARLIPNCRATFYPREAHSSTVVHHRVEILRSCAGETARARSNSANSVRGW